MSRYFPKMKWMAQVFNLELAESKWTQFPDIMRISMLQKLYSVTIDLNICFKPWVVIGEQSCSHPAAHMAHIPSVAHGWVYSIFKCEPCELWCLRRTSDIWDLKAHIKYSFSHTETCGNKMENYRPRLVINWVITQWIHCMGLLRVARRQWSAERHKTEKQCSVFHVSDGVSNVQCLLICLLNCNCLFRLSIKSWRSYSL